ncbi:MAG: NYN domain-containing protein [Gemmatimonadetes bacterium]|nr:NYN domain-containing protein [Gemmatimonadota bacterium]
MDRLAILIDGEFMRLRLKDRLASPPRAADIVGQVSSILDRIQDRRVPHPIQLYRAFFYTAGPSSQIKRHPLTGQAATFGDRDSHRENRRLIENLDREEHMAVRRGELVFRGWGLKRSVVDRQVRNPGEDPPPLAPDDLQPRFEQKGVDMRIGLDIASLALKRLVTDVAVVTRDSDMVPAFKLARREGLRVHLDRLGVGRCEQLCIHSDTVIG